MGEVAALAAVRADVAQAEEYLARACRRLRQTGWPETADDLSRTLALLRTYSKHKTGLLAQLEAATDWPADWPDGTPMRSILEVGE